VDAVDLIVFAQTCSAAAVAARAALAGLEAAASMKDGQPSVAA